MPFVIPKKGFIVGKLCQDLYEAVFKQKENGSDLLNSYILSSIFKFIPLYTLTIST